MVGIALLILVLGGTVLQGAVSLAFRGSKAAVVALRIHAFLRRICARILIALCLPGAMFCAAALYMRSWDQSVVTPFCLALFIGGGLIGAMLGLRQRDRAPGAF